MPRVSSSYRAPFLLRNAHLNTVYPVLTRRVPCIDYRRERLELADGDFLDLDWLGGAGDQPLAVLCHGLESSSNAKYMRGMAHMLHGCGWDILAVNYRGCSGEDNRLPRSYHSGATEDLDAVIRHVELLGWYQQLALIGFSLGGNLVLKYLGEGWRLPSFIKAAACISVPCDLASSAEQLASSECRFYMSFFAKSLKSKLQQKAQRFPGIFSKGVGHPVRSFAQFDAWYTALAHGFASAEDYWERCSSRPFLRNIKIPTLLINAQDDPFLPEACYPEDEALENPNLYLEVPAHGGHLGFASPEFMGVYWHERRVASFLASFIPLTSN